MSFRAPSFPSGVLLVLDVLAFCVYVDAIQRVLNPYFSCASALDFSQAAHLTNGISHEPERLTIRSSTVLAGERRPTYSST